MKPPAVTGSITEAKPLIFVPINKTTPETAQRSALR
jgi:hypothetical protein